MASSIKIRSTTKERLDHLQANILINFNKKLSQQDLIELLIQYAQDDLERMLNSNILTIEKANNILKLSESWGIATDADMLDDILVDD